MNELHTKIAEHLNNGGKVIIATYTKATQYGKKHVDMFSSNDKEPGVYIVRGKGKEYAAPGWVAIRFV